MPMICYVPKRFNAASDAVIDQARSIMNEYAADGYDLTLRQLYYQFVARDLIPNSLQSYKRLGSIVNDARLAGLLDWDLMVDRTRNLRGDPTWSDPSSIVSACAAQFEVDLWEDQPHRVEVWIEKDALSGVFGRVCRTWQIPFFACRGYVSQSEQWRAAQRLSRYRKNGQRPIVLHFGDHDPSGVDMTRDIVDRLELLSIDGQSIEVRRLALNMDQVRAYGPPPNPAKITDSRAKGYIAEHGRESWELDALDPATLSKLVDDEVRSIVDADAFEARRDVGRRGRDQLSKVADAWSDVVDYLDEGE